MIIPVIDSYLGAGVRCTRSDLFTSSRPDNKTRDGPRAIYGHRELFENAYGPPEVSVGHASVSCLCYAGVFAGTSQPGNDSAFLNGKENPIFLRSRISAGRLRRASSLQRGSFLDFPSWIFQGPGILEGQLDEILVQEGAARLERLEHADAVHALEDFSRFSCRTRYS